LIGGLRSSGVFEFLGWSLSIFDTLEAPWLSRCRTNLGPYFYPLPFVFSQTSSGLDFDPL